VLASFGLNESVFTSFQRKKGPAIAKKVQCTEEKRHAALKKVRAELRKAPPALILD
jgi:hypothetical protein